MTRSKTSPIGAKNEDLTEKFRVAWDKTTWKRDLESFAFQCTDELAPLDHFIGQDRAQEAIRFGLEVDKPGYNLFVTGLTGTGKTSAIQTHLQSIVDNLDRQEKRRPISDWTYVYNFEDPDRPNIIRLPRGSGKAFRQQFATALRTLQEEIPKMLKSEGFEAQVRSHEETDRNATQDLMSGLEQAGQSADFAVQLTPNGITIFPMTEGRPMTPEEFQALSQERQDTINETREHLMQLTQATMPKMRDIEKETGEKIKALEEGVRDLLAEMVAETLADTDEQLYTDPGRAPVDDAGELSAADRDAMLDRAFGLLDPGAAGRALARWLSTPRQTGLDFLIDPAHIRAADPATALIRHGGARLLCHGDTAWLNGEPWPLNQGQKPLARLLARQRRYRHDELAEVLNADSRDLLNHWIDQGYFAEL